MEFQIPTKKGVFLLTHSSQAAQLLGFATTAPPYFQALGDASTLRQNHWSWEVTLMNQPKQGKEKQSVNTPLLQRALGAWDGSHEVLQRPQGCTDEDNSSRTGDFPGLSSQHVQGVKGKTGLRRCRQVKGRLYDHEISTEHLQNFLHRNSSYQTS